MLTLTTRFPSPRGQVTPPLRIDDHQIIHLHHHLHLVFNGLARAIAKSKSPTVTRPLVLYCTPPTCALSVPRPPPGTCPSARSTLTATGRQARGNQLSLLLSTRLRSPSEKEIKKRLALEENLVAPLLSSVHMSVLSLSLSLLSSSSSSSRTGPICYALLGPENPPSLKPTEQLINCSQYMVWVCGWFL